MYLVERVASSDVVVRIESLGLVPRALSEPELVMQGLRRGLEMVGPWNSTSSHHHTRIRLRLREP